MKALVYLPPSILFISVVLSMENIHTKKITFKIMIKIDTLWAKTLLEKIVIHSVAIKE